MKRTLLILLVLALAFSVLPVVPAVAQTGGTTYTVQPGDNLFRIALKFNTTVAAIQAANGKYPQGAQYLISMGSLPVYASSIDCLPPLNSPSSRGLGFTGIIHSS